MSRKRKFASIRVTDVEVSGRSVTVYSAVAEDGTAWVGVPKPGSSTASTAAVEWKRVSPLPDLTAAEAAAA